MNFTDPLLLELVVEDLTERVEKMEDTLQLILDKLKSIEEAQQLNTQLVQHHQQKYMYSQADSPVDQGFRAGYPEQSYFPPCYSTGGTAPPHHVTPRPSHRSTLQPSLHATPHRCTDEVPRSFSIRLKNPERALASSEINHTTLCTVEEVMAKYRNLKGEAKAPTLAVKLAREAVFGDEVLMKCTPVAGRELPGLPIAELQLLKQTIFSKFPHYWTSPSEFETLWRDCMNSIGQLCKRLRSQ